MREKTKTKIWREYNEELGRYEWHEEETSKYVFDEKNKIAVWTVGPTLNATYPMQPPLKGVDFDSVEAAQRFFGEDK